MVPKPAAPIVRRKLSHEVTDRLLKEIESGDLAPGSRLPSERELMEIYGVGRPAIREALQTLENMGVISITHGERARVNALDARDMLGQIDRTARHVLATSPTTLDDLKEARLLFEVGMVRIAARKATPQDIESLEAWIRQLEQSTGDPQRFVQADMGFHTAIAAISRNPICAAVSEAMLKWLSQFFANLVRAPGREEVTIDEHRRILDRIAAHDEEGAAAAVTDHLTRANKLYLRPQASERSE